MNKSDSRPNKVLIAFDSLTDDQRALEFGSAVADHLSAHLSALFVEDINLFHVAGLPFALEIDRITLNAQPLAEKQLTQKLDKKVRQIKHQLAEIQAKSSREISLQIVRGHYFEEALSATERGDCLLLQKKGRRQRNVLKTGRRHKFSSPVWTIFDGSPDAERALTISADLARNLPATLNIVLKCIAGETLGELKVKVRELIADKTVHYNFFLAEQEQKDSLKQCVLQRGCSILVIPVDDAESLNLYQTAGFFSGQLDCPVLIIK